MTTDTNRQITEAIRYVRHARGGADAPPILWEPVWEATDAALRIMAADLFRMAVCDVPLTGAPSAVELKPAPAFMREGVERWTSAQVSASTVVLDRDVLLDVLPKWQTQKRNSGGGMPMVHLTIDGRILRIAGHVVDEDGACKPAWEEWATMPGATPSRVTRHVTVQTRYLTAALRALPHARVSLTVAYARGRERDGTGSREPIVIQGVVPADGEAPTRGAKAGFVRELRYREYVMPVYIYHPLDMEEAA